MIGKKTSTISINLVGEVTSTHFLGDFEVKIFLTHAEDLLRDKIRKDLLGKDPDASSDRARNQAEVLSQLQVRIVKAPLFWESSGNGMSLYDDNIIVELYEKCMKATEDAVAEIKKKAEEAKAELQKSASV